MDKAYQNISYQKVTPPVQHWPKSPVSLTKETMDQRLNKVLRQMEEKGTDVLCVYADREHG